MVETAMDLALPKLKRRLAEGGITITYEVDAAGVSRSVGAEAAKPLGEKDIAALVRCVDAVPIWVGDAVEGVYALQLD